MHLLYTKKRAVFFLRTVAILTIFALSYSNVRAQDSKSVRIEIDEITRPDVAVSQSSDFLVITALGHLFRVPTGGGEAEQLTFGPYFDSDPAISPDGRKVVFASDRDGRSDGNLFILELETKKVRQLTNEFWAARPVWSPDGTTIAYVSYEPVGLWAEYEFVADNGVQTSVKTIPAKGGESKILTASPGLIRSVSYLSDGRVVWTRVDTAEGKTETHDLGTHAKMGASRTRIEVGGSNSNPLLIIPGVVDRIVPSADGEGLFVRRYKIPASAYMLPQTEELAYVSLNNGTERTITDLTNPHPRPAFGVTKDKVFLGDKGKLWCIDSKSGSKQQVEFNATASMELLPKAKTVKYDPQRELSSSPSSILDPQISPDGTQLVFTAAGYLWIQPISGGPSRRLFEDDGFQWGAAVFSPDGKKLAYQHSEGNIQQLRVADLEEGTSFDLVTVDRTGRFEPVWSTDGKKVIYVNFNGMFPSIWSVDILNRQRLKIIDLPPRWMPRPQICACPSASEIKKSMGKSHVPVVNEEYLYYTKVNQIFRRKLAGDSEEEAITAIRDGYLGDGTISPDGKWLAFRRNDEIWVGELSNIPVTDQQVRKLSSDGGVNFTFSPDSRSLIYAEGGKVWKQAVTGGKPVEIKINLKFPRPSRNPVVIKNVHVLDFNKGGFTGPTSIAIENGKIQAIGPNVSLNDAKVVDASGRYAIPGLWDSHVHTATPIHFNSARDVSHQSANIAFGVTSVRDMGSDITLVKAWTDRRTAYAAPVPRIFSAGAMVESTNTFFHGGSTFVHDDESAREVVRREKDAGCCGIKSYLTLTWPLHRSVADEALKVEIPVYAHNMIFRESVMGAVLGRRSIEHQPFPIRLYSDVFKLLAVTDTKWCPTVAPYGGNTILFAQQPHLLSDPKLRAFTSHGDFNMQSELSEGLDARLIAKSMKELLTSINEGHEMGVPILAGTDALNPSVFYGHGLHMELRHMANAGVPMIDLLRIATLNAAENVGAEEQLGSIEKGKLADIVILNDNPLKDIRHLMEIWRVVQDGRMFSESAELLF